MHGSIWAMASLCQVHEHGRKMPLFPARLSLQTILPNLVLRAIAPTGTSMCNQWFPQGDLANSPALPSISNCSRLKSQVDALLHRLKNKTAPMAHQCETRRVPSSAFQRPAGKTTERARAPFSTTGATIISSPKTN